MHCRAPGAPAVAEFAVPALSSKRPWIAEQKTILKEVEAMAVLHGIMPLIDGLTRDDMLAFSSPPVDEVFSELIEGTAEARERRDVKRKEYAIAAKRNAAQYRLALGKKLFIAELIFRGVLEEHNGSAQVVVDAVQEQALPPRTYWCGRAISALHHHPRPP